MQAWNRKTGVQYAYSTNLRCISITIETSGHQWWDKHSAVAPRFRWTENTVNWQLSHVYTGYMSTDTSSMQMFYSRIQVDTCRRGDNLFCRQYRIQCRRRQGIQMDTTFIRATCIRCKRGIKPRLHLIHVARYKLYPALVSIGIACRRLHVSSATKLSLRRHVSTCIRIQVARPGYLYPAVCGVNAALDAILTPTSPCARLGNA